MLINNLIPSKDLFWQWFNIFQKLKIEHKKPIPSIHFQRQDESYFEIGVVSQVPLRYN